MTPSEESGGDHQKLFALLAIPASTAVDMAAHRSVRGTGAAAMLAAALAVAAAVARSAHPKYQERKDHDMLEKLIGRTAHKHGIGPDRP